MAFNISPQVNIYEEDNTQFVETKGDTVGSMAGYARWGQCGIPRQILTGSTEFVNKFHTPDDNTNKSFFIAQDFFKYSNKLYFTRVIGDKARNSIVGAE